MFSIDWRKWWVGIFSNKKSPLSSQTAGRIIYNMFTLMN